MSSNAIDIIDLIKEFRVYHRKYASIKARAAAIARSLISHKLETGFETRRILDGITLNIKHGEAVALVGRNGSGKSTLLSILSRIYLPTSGEAVIDGKLMSLLELGAGFHGDLTGSENLFFNGVMMGLTQDQITQRYESILSFAGLDPHLMDLPVRMYSSGMQLRLAFSMAIHLDADTILIDEGLAVGDESFQERCFRKLEELHASGRTILMVTHELDHIERLAQRVIWLDRGKIRLDGEVKPVLDEYRKALLETAS